MNAKSNTWQWLPAGRRVKKGSGSEVAIFVHNAGGMLVAEYATELAEVQQVAANAMRARCDSCGGAHFTIRAGRFGQADDNARMVDDYNGDGRDDLAGHRVFGITKRLRLLCSTWSKGAKGEMSRRRVITTAIRGWISLYDRQKGRTENSGCAPQNLCARVGKFEGVRW